jgi:nitrate reductase delta subunit
MGVNTQQFIPLISYPVKENLDKISTLRYSGMNEDGNRELEKFCKFMYETELSDLQERFTQTFDMNPDTCLDIGWHIYGEAYQRGVFMVKIREMLRQQGVMETTELPDHLTHILAVLGGLPWEDQKQFVQKYVLSALRKIKKGFEGTDNPYQNAIGFLLIFFQSHYEIKEGEV